MSVSRQTAARAAAVSRALRAAGHRPSKPSRSAPVPPLEVSASGGHVSVVVSCREWRAVVPVIVDALAAAGYVTGPVRSGPGYALIPDVARTGNDIK